MIRAHIPSICPSPSSWSRFRPVRKAAPPIAEIAVPSEASAYLDRSTRKTASWRLGFGDNGLICVGETINAISEHFTWLRNTTPRRVVRSWDTLVLYRWEGNQDSGYWRPCYSWPSRLWLLEAPPTIERLVHERILKS